MKKWKITVQAAGYSRGYMSAIVEAETDEDAKKMAREVDDWGSINVVRDDREVDDWDWVEVAPYEEPAAKEGLRDIINHMRARAQSCDENDPGGLAVCSQLQYYARRIEAALG